MDKKEYINIMCAKCKFKDNCIREDKINIFEEKDNVKTMKCENYLLDTNMPNDNLLNKEVPRYSKKEYYKNFKEV